MIDFNWVFPRLAVGARLAPEAVALVASHGIRAVVDLREEEADDEALLAAHGMELLRLPTTDRFAPSLAMLDLGIVWVEERLAAERPVLIHCQHGVGRSALLSLCVLVRTGLEPMEALRTAKAGRRVISPSQAQLQQYRVWLDENRALLGAAWAVPSLEELSELAYSHLRPAPAAPAVQPERG